LTTLPKNHNVDQKGDAKKGGRRVSAMTEFMANPDFFASLLLFATFYSLATASVVMALFIYNRKYPVLINSVVLYIFFFIAFSLYLLRNEQIMEALKTAQEPEHLSKTNTWLLLVLIFVTLVLDTISLRRISKGFAEARADIKASVKALIPSNSMWKPEQGLTENIIKKYRITEAEQTVANLALLGKSNKEIAGKLHKAVGTVEAQLKSVYQKTGAPGRYALISLVANSKTEENDE
jgi:DNA-binding CsgD family transcriptional regulator